MQSGASSLHTRSQPLLQLRMASVGMPVRPGVRAGSTTRHGYGRLHMTCAVAVAVAVAVAAMAPGRQRYEAAIPQQSPQTASKRTCGRVVSRWRPFTVAAT